MTKELIKRILTFAGFCKREKDNKYYFIAQCGEDNFNPEDGGCNECCLLDECEEKHNICKILNEENL